MRGDLRKEIKPSYRATPFRQIWQVIKTVRTDMNCVVWYDGTDKNFLPLEKEVEAHSILNSIQENR